MTPTTGRGQNIIRSIEHGVVEFLLTESPDDRPRLKLLEALQALKAAAPRRRYWPDLAVARMQQTLRSGLIDGASDPSSARHYFPDDVEGWLKLTGYHGDAADQAHELCKTAIGTLLDAAEADTNDTSRNILLGQVENVLHAGGWEPLLVARLEEVERPRGRSAGKRTNRPVRRPTSGGSCAGRPRGRKRQRSTVTTRTSSGCSMSTDSRQPGQPDSVGGCTSRNAAGWPKRWRRCATTIELERRCPVRRRQRRRGGRIRSASGPGSVTTGLGSVPPA